MCGLALFSNASGQTSPITSSGLNTHVSAPSILGGKVQYDITGGTRPGNGPNLFHSFGDFGVPNNNIANFLNDTGLATSNILSRVTGGNPSNIFGTVQTTGFGNANLFVMNPAGILFGPNATLNVGGPVHFTTADYLRLTDEARFNRLPNAAADGLLSAAPVAAFGFLSSSPTAITVQGSALSVPLGESISLVGGEITIQSGVLDDGTTQAAHLSAPAGQVRLGSVASAGEILQPPLKTAFNIAAQTFSSMGTITVSENATIDVSSDAAGTVLIRGGQLVMDNARISSDTINADGASLAVDIQVNGDLSITTNLSPAITARTRGSGNAGEVRIAGSNMVVTGTTIEDLVRIVDSHTSGSGNAGNVSITTTANLDVTGNPFGLLYFIDSGTIGGDGGHGGNAILTAKNINLQSASINTGDFIATSLLFEEAVGSGGNLMITADSLKLTQSFIATGASAGRGGDLTISARDVQINDFSALAASGFERGGTLRIDADQLVADSSLFEVSTTGPGSLGIIITGKVIEFKNGSTITSLTFGNGTAGNITITAMDHLTLSDDPSTVGAETGPSGLLTNTFGNFGGFGSSGAITVTTPRLEISGGARIDSSTRSSGRGGDVIIVADVISMAGERPTPPLNSAFGLGSTRQSGIFTRTVGSRFCTGPCGEAGNVLITTGSLKLDSGAQINSGTTNTGRGGDVTINATGPVSISGTLSDGTPSGIFSRTIGSASGSGRGGEISLHAAQFQLSSGASMSSGSTGIGDAGNIAINAADSFVIRNSAINTSTTQSDGGNITIEAGNLVHLGDSQIATNVQGGAGNGGNITIDPPTVILEHSNIIASAIGGNGGNINIVAGVFLVSPDSIIDASSTFGLSGTINIESPITNLSGTLAPLPQGFLQAAAFPSKCAARIQGGQSSSLVVRSSRDRIPPEPGDLLLSPLFASSQSASMARRSNDLDALRADLVAISAPRGCPS
jgi:filamentous hemagglutinin family protein